MSAAINAFLESLGGIDMESDREEVVKEEADNKSEGDTDWELDVKDVLGKEIDLIQSCISRMAQNSFVVKGWTITLVAVVLALLPERFNSNLLSLIGIVATLCFWYLDGFFLRTEKLYRWKYEWVIENRLVNKLYFYDLNPYNQKMWKVNDDGNSLKKPKILRVMFTKTLTPIYSPLLILSIASLLLCLYHK